MTSTATTATLPLRDYQSTLIRSVYEQWHHAPRVLAQLPTGGGKTVVFSHIGHEFTKRGDSVLVLAHRTELITQAADKLRAIADCPVGIVKAGHKPDYTAPIQVASVQSVVRRLAHLRPPGLVIIDEAHHSTASSYRKV
jgi:superfamily II DNA or RNA helicase